MRTSAESSPRAVLEHDRAQHRALRERQPLPRAFEHHLLLGQQPLERLMQIVERRAAPPARAHLVPGFVRQPLHVVRQVARQLDDRRAEPLFGPHARLA